LGWDTGGASPGPKRFEDWQPSVALRCGTSCHEKYLGGVLTEGIDFKFALFWFHLRPYVIRP